MQDLFITKIHVNKVRNIENLDILLSATERKHLILTGKNGSGKTSLLEAMRDRVLLEQRKSFSHSNERTQSLTNIVYGGIDHTHLEKHAAGVLMEYSVPDLNYWQSMFVYLSAERKKLTPPSAIEPMNVLGKELITLDASKDFLKYILSLDYQLYGAKSDGNVALEVNLTKWFDRFEGALRDIYDCKKLQLQRDTKNLSFKIAMPGYAPFSLHEMSDGYKAFLDIFMELLMRMETDNGVVNYEQSAIVLIDEIETHLHVELQKRALPFLTKMFPNVQFIVATHSPFVITSIDNAVVFDLEKRIRLPRGEDDLTPLTDYSYTDIVEGYFDEPEYSESLQADFDRYVALVSQTSRTPEERKETRKLFDRLSNIPGTSPLSTAFYMFNRSIINDKVE